MSMSAYSSRKVCDQDEAAYLRSVGNPVRFNWCWWFWAPRLRWNGGKPWRDVCTSVGVQWLRFGINVDYVR